MALPELSELVALPSLGRVFERPVAPGFADCSPSGRTRLDSLARWLQDVAYADVADAGMAAAAVWVLRRTRIRVSRWPRFGEEFRLATFCSGLGRMWAERRTVVRQASADAASGPADVETVALWVHLAPEDWRPVPLSQPELELYAPSAAGRRVTARLHHPGPPGAGPGSPWRFRATELDIADHINNSAYWQPLEQELLDAPEPEPESIDVEVEFRAPAQPGEKRLVGDGGPLRPGAMRWISGADGELHASILVAEVGSS